MASQSTACRSTRQIIIEAAGALFAQRGMGGVGIREIVREAGTSLSSVNYHFTSKEKLYVACLKHIYDDRLGLQALFSAVDDAHCQGPQEVSDLLAMLIHRTLVAFLGEGTPEWYGTLMVRSRMELHHKSPRALFRLGGPLKLRRFVQEQCPSLSAVFVEYWFISLMAQLQYYIVEKEPVLLGFGLDAYDGVFLENTARFMADQSAQVLGLPLPSEGCLSSGDATIKECG